MGLPVEEDSLKEQVDRDSITSKITSLELLSKEYS